jgi:hypothetical protein
MGMVLDIEVVAGMVICRHGLAWNQCSNAVKGTVMGILHAPFADNAKATCRGTIVSRLSLALLMVVGLFGIGVVAQEADELVTTGSGFGIDKAEVGRYRHNGGSGESQSGDLSVATAAVGSYLPNNWGLYDMHGNVFEWCLDWYVADLGTALVVDPVGGTTGSGRVIRGGSWYGIAGGCRSASRGLNSPSSTNSILGFRAALAPQD